MYLLIVIESIKCLIIISSGLVIAVKFIFSFHSINKSEKSNKSKKLTDEEEMVLNFISNKGASIDAIKLKLDLKNIQTIHARAEEFGQNKKYREKFDIATSRAVANLATLSEYLLPLVKVNGRAICMKGPGATEEISGAKNAIKLLGGKIQNIYEFELPHSDIERCVIEITKEKNIQSKYPRKAGTPAKDPLK